MDGFDRIYIPDVDMGADEVDCEEISHPADFNADGCINMGDIPKFAAAWYSVDPDYYDPNYHDPNLSLVKWNPECDIAGVNHTVDIEDLVALADVWLDWQACWLDTGEMMGMMMMAPGGGGGMELSAVSGSALAVPVAEEAVEEAVPMATLEEMTAWLAEIYGDNEEFQQEYSPQDWAGVYRGSPKYLAGAGTLLNFSPTHSKGQARIEVPAPFHGRKIKIREILKPEIIGISGGLAYAV